MWKGIVNFLEVLFCVLQLGVSRAFVQQRPHSIHVPSDDSTARRNTLSRHAIMWSPKKNRFDRTSSDDTRCQESCKIRIDGEAYDLTHWARAHPGGHEVLQRFHGKDASVAFHSAAHSQHAYDMLAKFAVGANTRPEARAMSGINRWKQKLFTNEDPRGIHKTLGIFVLLHFAFRFSQMLLGDPSAGLGSRMGKGPSIFPALCLIPHAFLSISSLIFQTVPRERVVGKPMIWSEYRAHNIVFGLRSVLTTFLAWLSIYKRHQPIWRRTAVIGSCTTVLLALLVADEATRRLRSDESESTTATMPYWEGCSIQTEKSFKLFYAYCQFLATLACLHVTNPAWSLAVLLPIQLASLLMTLVRKGLISAQTYHLGYTASLVLPFAVALRSSLFISPVQVPLMFVIGSLLFLARRCGIGKYALWLPLIFLRIACGDQFLPYSSW